MVTSLLLNFFTGLVALALTSSVAFHDSRIDAAFVSAITPSSDTSGHDSSHALSHDFHIHGSRQSTTDANPAMANRLSKRHAAAHNTRHKLSSYDV